MLNVVEIENTVKFVRELCCGNSNNNNIRDSRRSLELFRHTWPHYSFIKTFTCYSNG